MKINCIRKQLHLNLIYKEEDGKRTFKELGHLCPWAFFTTYTFLS